MANVLVVDDEPLCREFVTRTLAHLGHQVASAADGETALDLLRRPQITDLLIVDIRLKQLDGLAVVRAMEKIQPDLPVIVTTGYVLPADAPSLFRRGNISYLPKPFGLQLLINTVQEALASTEHGGRPARGLYSEHAKAQAGEALAESVLTSSTAPVAELLTLESAVKPADTAVAANDQSTSIRRLLSVLDACVTPGSSEPPGRAVNEQRRHIVHHLIVAAASCTTVESLLVCASGLRTLGQGRRGSLERASARLAQWLREANIPGRHLDPRVAAVLAEFHARGRNCGQLRESELAADLGIDPAHLGHLLRKQTGFGFIEWSRGVRLFLAVRALARDDQQVKTIAYDCGFSDAAQFSKAFRQLFGLTPRAFRAALGHTQNGQLFPKIANS